MAAACVLGAAVVFQGRAVREIRYPQVSAIRLLDDIEPLSPTWQDVYTMFIHLFGGLFHEHDLEYPALGK